MSFKITRGKHMDLEFEIEKLIEEDFTTTYKVKRKGLIVGKLMLENLYKEKEINKMVLKK